MEKVIVNSLINNFKKDYETTPTFEELLQDYIKLRGITATEFSVPSLQKGWLLNGGEELDFSSIYNKYFGYDRIPLYEKLEEIEFSKYKIKKENKEELFNSGGTQFDEYVWGVLEDFHIDQHHISGFITNVYENNFEITFNIKDIIHIPKSMDIEYPKIKGIIPKEKYKYFDSLTIEKFKNTKFDVKILFIEKSSKTLILKPCNYEK
ncbi:hypothetical protein AQ1689_110095 [Tenacibaculum maritimum]|uniref:hypothetical protein n=1 Tax=Tenacibaculum maritimum TaxID=107401 RepID=UPI0012E5BD26|nr:hypothetical protein [Tenacibaculum maritimum]CAA0143788.1 hypothetical protein AQ1685_100095 [Tenacibaculum maritimum]CAA0144418.1 hypothetical protein AQ1689_110095 [Tenacibaculum maritimum]CAA0205487.1 hypothetical protein AQ1688_90051 [Tenacibaculum maritimum]CAA0248470.1 hypothetical protein JIP32914_70096 [Tenacibaculum maritimum]